MRIQANRLHRSGGISSTKLWAVPCDIQVSTALHESFGVATLEAMFAGNACLLPRHAVYPELCGSIEESLEPRTLRRSMAGLTAQSRGWGRWRATEALGVRLPKLSAWLDDSADPTARERERITSVFGPGLP
jgi:hypothetical protein